MKSFPITYNEPVIEQVLEHYSEHLGDDFKKYRNHVYRVFHYALYIVRKSEHMNSKVRGQIAYAAAFHDIGIWTDKTFDYLKPSIFAMQEYLQNSPDTKIIAGMIFWHHKTSAYVGKYQLLIESFRRADWIDVTKGMKSFGVPKQLMEEVTDVFPYLNFHITLMKKSFQHVLRHPFKPFPMFKN